jgi:hypothetical protein
MNLYPRQHPLLEIQAGSKNDPLLLTLHVMHNIQSAPPYADLSYCWGGAKDRVEVTCNDRQIFITSNFHAALHRLRQDQQVWVWADALCINQDHILERNHQVSIMAEIYSNASIVCIWLSHSTRETSEAMTAIRALVSRAYTTMGTKLDLSTCLSELSIDDSKKTEFESAEHGFELEDITNEQWMSFCNLYQYPWFFRIWVIQEVRTSKNARLFCGNFAIDWRCVAIAASMVDLKRHEFDNLDSWANIFHRTIAFANFALMWTNMFRTPRTASFIALLEATGYSSHRIPVIRCLQP